MEQPRKISQSQTEYLSIRTVTQGISESSSLFGKPRQVSQSRAVYSNSQAKYHRVKQCVRSATQVVSEYLKQCIRIVMQSISVHQFFFRTATQAISESDSHARYLKVKQSIRTSAQGITRVKQCTRTTTPQSKAVHSVSQDVLESSSVFGHLCRVSQS